jgi:hypothetical protein
MAATRTHGLINGVRLIACAGLCAALGACASIPTVGALTPGGVDPNSSVAGEVAAAIQAPGPYPQFSKIPAMPTDVRPDGEWRQDVVSVWSAKRQLDAEAKALKFTLANTDGWATAERAKINPVDAAPPPLDATLDAETFAAAERARATPPPQPK